MRIQPRDLVIFEAIQRHGPLSSRYLFEFTRDRWTDPFGFSKRLLALYRNNFIDRPLEVNPTNVHDDFKVYILKPKAEDALAVAGTLYEFPQPTKQGYEHQMMTGAITASIDLECRKIPGYRFIDREEIMRNAPDTTKRSKRPFAIPAQVQRWTKIAGKRTLETSRKNWCEPDDVFGIEYGPKSRRYFALEADRGTENITRPDIDDNSIERKGLAYHDILKKGMFEKHFGVAKMYPTFITVSATRARNMLTKLEEVSPEYSDLYLAKWLPGFELYQKTPPLFPQLFTDPYERIGTPFFIGKQ